MWTGKNCGDFWTRATRGDEEKKRNENKVLLLTPVILEHTICLRMGIR